MTKFLCYRICNIVSKSFNRTFRITMAHLKPPYFNSRLSDYQPTAEKPISVKYCTLRTVMHKCCDRASCEVLGVGKATTWYSGRHKMIQVMCENISDDYLVSFKNSDYPLEILVVETRVSLRVSTTRIFSRRLKKWKRPRYYRDLQKDGRERAVSVELVKAGCYFSPKTPQGRLLEDPLRLIAKGWPLKWKCPKTP